MSVKIGLIEGNVDKSPTCTAGFLIGARSELDYRGAALAHHNLGKGGGIFAGMSGTGIPVFSESPNNLLETQAPENKNTEYMPEEFELRLKAQLSGETSSILIEVCAGETGNGRYESTRTCPLD